MLLDGTESVYRSIARVCCTIQSIVMICRFTVRVTYFVLACLSAVCLLFTFFPMLIHVAYRCSNRRGMKAKELGIRSRDIL